MNLWLITADLLEQNNLWCIVKSNRLIWRTLYNLLFLTFMKWRITCHAEGHYNKNMDQDYQQILRPPFLLLFGRAEWLSWAERGLWRHWWSSGFELCDSGWTSVVAYCTVCKYSSRLCLLQLTLIKSSASGPDSLRVFGVWEPFYKFHMCTCLFLNQILWN